MFGIIKKSEFARNSLTLVIGTVIAQLIPIALQPVLRRVFSDEEFGLFAQYFTLVSILSIIANFAYNNAIVIPKSDKSGINILAVSITLSTLFSFFLLIFLFFTKGFVFEMIGFSVDLGKYYWLIPISVLLVSSNMTFNFWLTRKKRFKGLAYNKATRRGVEGVARLGLGSFSASGGLFFGTLLGDFFNSLMFLFQMKRMKTPFSEISKKEMKIELRAQNEFPKFVLLPQLLNVLSSFLPIFLISALYSKAYVGQFDGSRELLAAPLALISLSISQVLLQKIASDSSEKRKIGKLMRSNLVFLAALGIVGVLIFTPFGVPIFELVYGEDWTMAGEISTILVFSYAIRFVVSPLSIVFIALKKMKISAIWQIGYFFVTINLLWFDEMSLKEFVFIFVLIDVLAYTVYGCLIYFTVKKYDKLIGS